MISYEIEGVQSLLKTLRQKKRVYRIYKRRILRNASKLGLKITQDNWFGIDDEVAINLSMTSNGFIVSAEGTQVLFLEFGSGVTYSGTKHPLASEMGYGPGTYAGKGYWNDPNGWFYYSNDPTKVVDKSSNNEQGVAHTFGNPAWGASYKSALAMKQEFTAMVIEELIRA